MSWRCKKCGSTKNITVIRTINFHDCELDKEGDIVNCLGGKTGSTDAYWCENCNNESEELEELAEWEENE